MEIISFDKACQLADLKVNFARVSFPNTEINPVWITWKEDEDKESISKFVDEYLLTSIDNKRIDRWVWEEDKKEF